MLYVKKIVDFYIDASIHVALAVYALSWVTLLEYNVPYRHAKGYVIFCATLVAYNLMKYGTKAKRHGIVSSSYLKSIQVFSFLCFIVGIFYAFQLHVVEIMILGIIAVLVGCYALPFLPNRKSFRTLHGAKIYVVAVCWSILTVIFPVTGAEVLSSSAIYIEWIQRFLLVLALMIPFDIRDLRYDEISLGTLPQKLGINKTKAVGIGILLGFYGLLFLKGDPAAGSIVIYGSIAISTGCFIYFSKENQNPYYSSFYVESIPIFWGVLAFAFDSLFQF